ncbi:MAG: bacteriocin immunity protein [Alkalibacterium sp.]|uniref:bacteriocin immunity protein n=1 Tax=Alkalibacterium sp. TaxID=1872447 RepID=UPI00264868D6|nr:bacteriocin immunity protein [Alkalibacterium sp.]MDN6294479.1 bacteriocin immunity protein [Alkalibacterium sp.]MDN6296130.1 bacteriocin immunity protein [Alkalibacterium sp.]MDN6385571.1 bacteriocin immunity protein [Alkalibacterium sp.]
MNEQQKEQIIDALSTAYSDPEVKKDPHMHQVLLDSAKQLTKDSDHRTVFVRLSKEISRFSLRNNLKTPQSLSDLYKLVKKEHESYSGTIAATTVWWGK